MSIERLIALQVDNDLKGLDMEQERGRFAALASRHEDGTAPRAVAAFNLFQTPEHIAAQLVALVSPRLRVGARILEPSAGLGRLFRPLWSALGNAGEYVLIDQSADCVKELYRQTEDCEGVTLRTGDFLAMDKGDLGGAFDVICMNPPFKMWRDIKHINHARAMLADGGILAALCANGPRQREHLRPLCTTWEELPERSFKSEGTGVSVALLTIHNTQEG